MIQPSLFQPEPPQAIYPGEPAVWIQRLVILPSRTRDAVPIRDIEFRRGLNVINTRVTSDTETTAFGHNVGKTMLIRLIRYCLGDVQFGSARVREKIHDVITEAIVVALVRVRGIPWSVCRAIKNPRHSYSLQTDDWSSLLDDAASLRPFSDFELALTELLPTQLTTVKVARGKRSPRWTDLLGWLIRDQHCRYISHNTWRYKEADSETDGLTDGEANLIARITMNLFDQQEHEFTDQLEEKRAQLRRLLADQSNLSQERHRMAGLLLSDAEITADLSHGDLAQSAIRNQLEEQRADSVEQLSRLQQGSDLTEAERQLAGKRTERDQLQGRISQLKLDLERVSQSLTLAQVPDTIATLESKKKAISCGMDGCLHLASHSLPPDPGREDRIREYQANKSQFENEIASFVSQLDQKQAAIDDANSVVQKARRLAIEAESEPRQRIARSDILLRRFDEFVKQIARGEQNEVQRQLADTRIKELIQEREARAQSRITQMELLNTVFREVTNGLIRRSTGNLSLDLVSGLTPNPDVTSGEAFGSAGHVLGFDLTCLTASIYGYGTHPRLLVHDSPREADLNEMIYRNLFRYVLSLESHFPGEQPAFQYIITTTSPPPDLVTTEHIRETLHDESDEGRLFGIVF